MKTLHLLFTVTIIFLNYAFASGQTGTLIGKVTDVNTDEPLIGATIQVVGTTIGTIANLNGDYSLPLEAGKYEIKISFMGFSTVTENVAITDGQDAVYNFTLVSDMLGLDQVIITGVLNPKSKLESSVAITTIRTNAIEKLGNVTTAEIFKSIPGIHSESTGGEGNANISVRGVPISTGGAKFLQLHEDGLPVLQFGDMVFGNADIFLRVDRTVGRIEAIRGGSASTLASNSPAGIINFISKNGSVEGGEISVTNGLDYRHFRTDFNVGAPIGDGFQFNIGGFYRQGEGVRKTGYDGNMGGQIKANITKNFKRGYARVYFKHLDDKATSYMPMPVLVTGTGENPTYKSIEGFDVKYATFQSPEFLHMTNIDAGNNPRTTDISDGMHPVSNALGSEFSFEVGEGWRIQNRNRLAKTSGSFRTLFPTGLIGPADEIATGIAGPGYTVSYANGANAGQTLSSSQLANLNGNGLLMELASFDVDINSFDNFTNDFNISKNYNNVDISFGYYKAYQQIATYWAWQGYMTDVSDNTKLVNIASADSSYYTEGGVRAYGQWGLGRKYDMKYNISAPYANLALTVNDNFNIDGSIRYDYGAVSGYYLNSMGASIDVNQDGIISPVEANSNVIDNSSPNTVGYDYGYLSYSVGANLKLASNQAIYGRISRGGRANADRLLYSQFITAEGKTIDGLEADMVTQVEFGFKYNSPAFALMFTPYYSSVSEQNADVTENKIYLIDFESYGAELEVFTRFRGFSATAGAIYTHAEIKESLDETTVGNIPRRVPAIMYNINPSYSIAGAEIGFSLIGTTKRYTQNSNELIMPGFAYVNAYASYEITKGLTLRANVNNLLNAEGYTESEASSITANTTNFVRARPISGRSSTLTLAYSF